MPYFRIVAGSLLIFGFVAMGAEAKSPQVKAMPNIAGITVALGSSHDAVLNAYPNATATAAGDLAIGSAGIKFFFTKDHKVLREIMLEAPFKASIGGVKIGDPAATVSARRGQPDKITVVFGGSGYLYIVGGNILRYDIDEKSKLVTDVVEISSS